MITRQAEIEGQLIRLTDQMANLALHPLTRASAENLRHLATKVVSLTATESVDGLLSPQPGQGS
ncbi:MAG: hypothetical protein KGZ72_10045 [Roseovarius sp.]|jgi:hypothetical protein|nr:hypothetical protein [Roseovarius sp.]